MYWQLALRYGCRYIDPINYPAQVAILAANQILSISLLQIQGQTSL